uniref:JNK1/MAPK8 associated membrane protein n=1 Tax=Molossus molossus TaxID=27622 RepID=A0A7J8JUA8_MOLMO|nr:JNK1/MAPK8 associated membrane protein [Molossus molossus]
MAQLNYMENVGCAQEDREQMHRSIVSLAQSLQNCMIGSILDSWLCFLLFYIGSSLNGIREKRDFSLNYIYSALAGFSVVSIGPWTKGSQVRINNDDKITPVPRSLPRPSLNSSSALFQHITALFECSMAAIVTLLVSDPVGVLYIRSCRVLMLSDWYTMLYNPSPDYVTTVHCTHEAVYPLYTIVFIYYAFCLVLMMLLRPLLVKKIACGLGKSDRFKSIYAALYFFPILTVLQAVGGGLLYYAFPYIILVLSLVTLAVYMSASEIENCYDLLVRKKRLIVLFSHWLLHAYGIISISRVDKLEQDLPLLALVPTPALFYLFTAKFTEPSRILSEGANGH